MIRLGLKPGEPIGMGMGIPMPTWINNSAAWTNSFLKFWKEARATRNDPQIQALLASGQWKDGAAALAKMNNLVKYAYTLEQVAARWKAVRPLQRYIADTMLQAAQRAKWTEIANDITKQHSKLSPLERNQLAAAMFEARLSETKPISLEDVRTNPDKYSAYAAEMQDFFRGKSFNPATDYGLYMPNAVPAKRAFYPLTKPAHEMRLEIRRQLDEFHTELEQAVIDNIVRTYGTGEQARALIEKVKQEYARQRDAEYVPFNRYGNFIVEIWAAPTDPVTGKVLPDPDTGRVKLERIHQIAYESKKMAEAQAIEHRDKLRKTGFNYQVKVSERPQETARYGSEAELPHMLIDEIAQTFPGVDLAKLKEFMAQRTGGSPFRSHMLRASKLRGFDADLMRNLNSYLFQGSSHLGHLKYNRQLLGHISEIRSAVQKGKTETDPAKFDTTSIESATRTLGHIADYMEAHHKHMNSDHSDPLRTVRNFGLWWTLVGVPSTLFQNASQP